MSFTTTIKNHLTKIKMRLMSTYQSDNPSNKLIAWMNKPDSVELSKYWTNKILDINDVMTGDNPRSISLNWMGMDSEKLFDSIDQQSTGWKFTKDNVKYTLNSLGYRGDEPHIQSDYTVLVIGDSHTFGVGLDDTQIWPNHYKLLLQQQHPNCKVINLSIPGGTNDAMARSISCAFNIVKPNCVIVCYTYPNRREAIWDSGILWQLNTNIPEDQSGLEEDEFQYWFMTINEHTDYYNWMKNHKLINAICRDTHLIETQVTQLKLIQKQLGTVLQYNDVARDCKHFGPVVHKEFAKKMYEKFCSLQNKEKKLK